ncbi:MAG: acetyl-CoA decarbonylase/synthase complex subunit gamma [bacterium]|nr:acetyl-CoA decarbonylase/synthase complex subunit gamma [bacterium]
MGLSGIEIFKKLPKKNCKECGVPTCLAFAMQLAQGKAELSLCPYVTDEVAAELSEASAPPIRTVTIGVGDNALKIGGETVMFRHDKTFENPVGFAILISDSMSEGEVDDKIKQFNETSFERVGLNLRPDLLALKSEANDTNKYASLVKKVAEQTEGNIILISESKEMMEAGLNCCKEKKPLLYAVTSNGGSDIAGLAKENGCPLAVKGANLEETAQITERLVKEGFKDLVIDSGARNIKQLLEDQIKIRRAALKGKYRPLGFPTITFPNEMTNDSMKEAMYAAIMVAKYAGIIVLSGFDAPRIFPLLVQRLNIYTDPQRPMVMEQKIYELNTPSKNSPVIVTTNFSLTYFIVSGEVEGSKVPTWLCIMDTEGLSTLTAWSAGKFVPDLIAAYIKKIGIADKVEHRKIIIPGYLAQIKGELEDELNNEWEVIVGPREAGDLPTFLQRIA